MSYQLQWTEPAEKSYKQLRQRAEACLDRKQVTHPAVLTFNEVEDALDTTLSQNPCDPDRSLAGMLSILYRLTLASVSIVYVVTSLEPVVIVLNISQRHQGLRAWLNSAIEDGTVEPLLEHVGIDWPGISVDVNDDWTN